MAIHEGKVCIETFQELIGQDIVVETFEGTIIPGELIGYEVKTITIHGHEHHVPYAFILAHSEDQPLPVLHVKTVKLQ